MPCSYRRQLHHQHPCKIVERCIIGSQSVLANGIEIGNDIIVGPGPMVNKSLLIKGTYFGIPVKFMKKSDVLQIMGGNKQTLSLISMYSLSNYIA